MRSNTQELHRLQTGINHRTTPASGMSPDVLDLPEVLDEAFALADESTWRCDTQHATEAEKALELQLASLAKQSRELTQLLGQLRSQNG